MNMERSELLKNKDFEALNKEERAFVLQTMSEEEYRFQRQLVTASSELMEAEQSTLQPPAVNFQDIVKHGENTNSRQRGLKSMIRLNVPLWAAAAACIIVFAIAYFLPVREMPREKVVEVKDTVYVDKYITEVKEVPATPDTLVKVIYKTIEKEVPPQAGMPTTLPDTGNARKYLEREGYAYDEALSSPGGMTVGEDSLMLLISSLVY